jgi:CubicO group peptidase (beta-lactamase class C family)
MRTTGYLIIRNDSLRFEYYSDHTDTTSISNSFSMAKSVVGLLTGCAIEDGYLSSIHQPVDELLTDFNHLKGKGLTLEHLLTMSSGSNWDEKYSSAFSITTKAYYGNNLDKLMREVEIVEKPGVHYRYKSGDTQLLAMVLTRATGKPLSAYAAEKLWQPMGAEKAALWSTDKKGGIEKAYCCFNSTARDFARFGSLILHLGQWKGQQLVPESYVIESITPASFLTDEHSKPLTYYGYQWWILHYRGRAIPYARGLQGQYIFVLPAENAVIVRLGHERSEVQINNHPLDVYTWVNLGLELLE